MVNVAAVEQQLICTTFEGAVTEVRIGRLTPLDTVPVMRRHALHVDQILGGVDADGRLALIVAQHELHLAALDAAAFVDVLDGKLGAVGDASCRPGPSSR